MSAAKHTPGPWFVAPLVSITHGTVNEPGAYSIADSADPNQANVLCSRFPWHERADEMAANARLIAAAPELLDMAECLRAVCARVIEQYGPVQCGVDFASLGGSVNRVLAKVNGEAA